MIFPTYAKLKSLGISRPSLAEDKHFYFSKLYPEQYEKRGGFITTIRIQQGNSYEHGKVIPVYLDDRDFHLFDAKITCIKPIKKRDITEGLARGDSDMTVGELQDCLETIYKNGEYGVDPWYLKIDLKVVENE